MNRFNRRYSRTIISPSSCFSPPSWCFGSRHFHGRRGLIHRGSHHRHVPFSIMVLPFPHGSRNSRHSHIRLGSRHRHHGFSLPHGSRNYRHSHIRLGSRHRHWRRCFPLLQGSRGSYHSYGPWFIDMFLVVLFSLMILEVPVKPMVDMVLVLDLGVVVLNIVMIPVPLSA